MKQVKHDNILPVYGVSNSLAPDFCLIFPWYENGNIMEYLKGNRNANRCDLASLHIQVDNVLSTLTRISRAVAGCGQRVALPA